MKSRPTLELETAKYEAMLDDPALSDAERQRLLQTLWAIVLEFVSLGFGVHPIQLAQDAAVKSASCGKAEDLPAHIGLDEVYLDQSLIADFSNGLNAPDTDSNERSEA